VPKHFESKIKLFALGAATVALLPMHSAWAQIVPTINGIGVGQAPDYKEFKSLRDQQAQSQDAAKPAVSNNEPTQQAALPVAAPTNMMDMPVSALPSIADLVDEVTPSVVNIIVTTETGETTSDKKEFRMSLSNKQMTFA